MSTPFIITEILNLSQGQLSKRKKKFWQRIQKRSNCILGSDNNGANLERFIREQTHEIYSYNKAEFT